jgi:glutamate-5-semialdehyde dehydrogenase
MNIKELAGLAKTSAAILSQALSGEKDKALFAIADALDTNGNAARILAANGEDIAAAKANGMADSMIDRLTLNEKRLADIAEAVRYVAGLEDPVGRVLDGRRNANGLQITRVAVPFGVVGIIFESRPNVTVDCAALCLKSGNACVLRGGKEAIHSNRALVTVMKTALGEIGFDADCIQLVEDTSRESASEMMRLNGLIDVLIPRGGAGLIKSVVENATVPVIETGTGNCHIFVDESADLDRAAVIVDNAKTTRPSVCNIVETALVHKAIAADFLPKMADALAHANVELRGCEETRRILGDQVVAAAEEDYATEFLDYILAVKVVADIDEAITHIARYSTHHSEAILTKSLENSKTFTSRVDSAAVYVNASTRFTDGGEFGLGAEIGISTQKLHARGPMGLAQLVSYKYIVSGDGQIRV